MLTGADRVLFGEASELCGSLFVVDGRIEPVERSSRRAPDNSESFSPIPSEEYLQLGQIY